MNMPKNRGLTSSTSDRSNVSIPILSSRLVLLLFFFGLTSRLMRRRVVIDILRKRRVSLDEHKKRKERGGLPMVDNSSRYPIAGAIENGETA